MKKLIKIYFIFNLILIVSIFLFNLSSYAKKTIPESNIQPLGSANDKDLQVNLIKPIPTPEQFNVADNFKLIAVYLIAKQPRALIKNLSIPEEGAKEFQTGDFIDEYQTIQVSKISLNPTTRVELLDQNGFAYLIKTQSFDMKAAGSKGGGGSKIAPTYFGGSAKSKPKKEKGTTASTQPEKQDKIQAPEQPKKEETATTVSAPPVDTTGQLPPTQTAGTTSQALQPTTTTTASAPAVSQKSVSQPSQGSTTQTAPAQPLPQAQDSLDVSRPSNPFAQ